MKKILPMFIIIVALVGAGVFYGGMRYQQSKIPSGNSMRSGVRFPGDQNTQGQLVNGQVIAQDATSVTVKLRDGSSKIVLVSGSITVSKMASGSLQDVTVGTEVMITGSANSDGSVTAQTVQIRPSMLTP